MVGKKRKSSTKGNVNNKDRATPAEVALFSSQGVCAALLLDMKRDTVTGIPPVPSVKNTAKRDNATWYNPSPSAPSKRDNTTRYKNPKPRSAMESAVTKVAVVTSGVFPFGCKER